MLKIILCTLCLLITVPAWAATIQNKLNQRLLINLSGGKTVAILPRGTATVADKDLSSPHLQTLIKRGEVVIVPSKPEDIKKPLPRK